MLEWAGDDCRRKDCTPIPQPLSLLEFPKILAGFFPFLKKQPKMEKKFEVVEWFSERYRRSGGGYVKGFGLYSRNNAAEGTGMPNSADL